MNQVDKGGSVITDAYGQIRSGTTVLPVTLGRAGCGLHPKYLAIGKPISRCRTCKAFYEVKHR